MKLIKTIALPPAETLEGIALQVWDSLRHYRQVFGPQAYAEASFTRDGKEYVIRITETKGETN
jgi:hypothetical protein